MNYTTSNWIKGDVKKPYAESEFNIEAIERQTDQRLQRLANDHSVIESDKERLDRFLSGDSDGERSIPTSPYTFQTVAPGQL